MNLGKARGLCPILTVLPYDFEAYDKASRALYLTLVEFADDIQAVSCDEAFIDISSKIFDSNSIISEMLIESKAKIIAEKIRERVLDSTKCNVSIGIAENMLLARLATKFAKPNNLFFLKTQDTQSFINKLEISELPGIGRNIAAKLFDNLHITQCSELYLIQQGVLQSLLGEKKGLTLYQFARGIDRRILENKSRRSVGAEVNWGIRFEKESDMTVFLDGLCDEVVKRLNFIKCKSGAISIKLKKRSSDQKPLKLLGHGICGKLV